MCKFCTPKSATRFHCEIEEYSLSSGTIDSAAFKAVHNYIANRFFHIGQGTDDWKTHEYLDSVEQRFAVILADSGYQLRATHRQELQSADDAWKTKEVAARAHGKEPAQTLKAMRLKLGASLIAGLKKTDDAKLPNVNEIMEAIGDVWIVKGNGDYVGAFPKRLSKYLHKNGITLTDEHVQTIGNIASAGLARTTTIRLDFTSRINWSAGDFGDSGSCYWGCRQSARKMLEENGGRAIRAYSENGEGIGRCWIADVPGESNVYVIWNAYGPVSLWDFARLVAHRWGMSYKKVALRNNDEHTGELWINDGLGIVIGSTEALESFSNDDVVDLGWDDLPNCTCSECGEAIDEDNARSVNGNPLCEDCYFDQYTCCYRCGEDIPHDEARNCNGGDYCEYCAERAGFRQCDHCNEMSRDTAETNCGNIWCDYCLTGLPFCEECEMYLETGDTRETVDSRCVCEECCGKMEQCEECNRYAPPESLETVVNEVVGDSVCRCGECHSEARRHRLEQTLALPFPDETASAHEATAHTQELLSIGM